jgi:uncharacterized protein (TIGR00255 family)
MSGRRTLPSHHAPNGLSFRADESNRHAALRRRRQEVPMLLSMTGFGEAQREENGSVYHVELRSVNNRYFKAAIHLPDELNYLEADLDRLVRSKLTRGSITVRLRVHDLSASAALDVNVEAIHRYIAALRSAVPDDQHTVIDLATLATLQGVCQPRELSEVERSHTQDVVLALVEDGISRLIEMRLADGRALAEDLRKHLQTIRRCLDAVRLRAPEIISEYRDKLHARVTELLAGSGVSLAADDLLREVSIYAERSDVHEEIQRLDGHLAQFEELLASGEPAGRKLDFVAQEMLREANTIGSKSGDSQIARAIIEIKASVDRIKEQVQNAE